MFVVIDCVEMFIERGLRLVFGIEFDVDIIVMVMGFNVLLFGGMMVSVDGCDVDFV